MPEGLGLVEMRAWQALRFLYDRSRLGTVTAELGSVEKRKILLALKFDQATQAFQNKLTDHHRRILRDTEAAKTAARKDPTPENILRLCDVLDGLEVMDP